MNKEEIQERAFLYACGALDEENEQRFEEQARASRELREETYAWQKINEYSVRELEQEEPPFQAYSGIMAQIDEASAFSRQGAVADDADRKGSRGKVVPFLAWGGWAAAACAALVFAVSWQSQVPGGSTTAGADNDPQFVVDASKSDIVLSDLRNPGSRQFAQVSNDIDDRMMEVTELAEAYWFSREGLPPEESVGGANADQWTDGFTIYDRKYKIGFIGVENMPEARVGKYYNVWARNSSDGRAVWAGSLPMGDASRGLFFFDLSNNEGIEPLDNAVSFFVTEDQTERPEKPQGPVVLGDL